jgi:hypothetical protein
MPEPAPPEHGTLLIAALLLLALAFAGYWIATYVQPGANPWAALPWFGIAAGVIIVVGLLTYMRPRRRKGGD